MTTTSPTGGSNISTFLNQAANAGNTTTSPGSGTTTPPTSGTPNSGGSLSAPGIGSGLNVSSIVSALVAARKAASQDQITTRTTQTTNLLKGLSSLNTSLGAIQTALATLSSASTFNSFTSTLTPQGGSSSIGTATTMSSAHAGSYTVSVSQLATAQKRASNVVAANTPVGQGTLNIKVGSSSMNLAVSATDSLSTIATAINNSSSNPGVTATIVNGANGQQLMLSSSKTGVANAFSISADATSSSGLLNLANTLNTAGSNEAQDAKLTLDNIPVTSPSNTVTGMMDGVTLNLTGTGTNMLTVAQDNTAATNAIQGLVDAYNDYVSNASSLSSFDTTTGVAGVLLGDNTLTSLQRQIGSVLSGSVKGNALGTLTNVGITRNADGTLNLDTSKLASAFQSNPGAVQDLFNGPNGYATNLGTSIGTYANQGGIISSRMDSLQDTLNQLGQQQTSLNARMATYQSQLQQQYTALDTLMSSLNNTSSYLTTALAQLNGSNSSKN